PPQPYPPPYALLPSPTRLPCSNTRDVPSTPRASHQRRFRSQPPPATHLRIQPATHVRAAPHRTSRPPSAQLLTPRQPHTQGRARARLYGVLGSRLRALPGSPSWTAGAGVASRIGGHALSQATLHALPPSPSALPLLYPASSVASRTRCR
ncbi:hypothetical protein B0H10DRAFT_2069226, partial [Mycena sp. CBHHK59/15]